MSWQTYVDDHLMGDIEGNHLSAAVILGHAGSVWEHYCVSYAINDAEGLFKDFGFPIVQRATGTHSGIPVKA